ncbi:MAG: hypothetical protein ACQER6_10320, partial [Pseudomonadota bacterium]
MGLISGLLLLIGLGLGISPPPAVAADTEWQSVRIGVLALRGKEKAREEWAPMAASVNARSESL